MPSHWENVNPEEPYQVRVGASWKTHNEIVHHVVIVLTSFFSSLFLCKRKQMNTMKFLISLEKQWIATE